MAAEQWPPMTRKLLALALAAGLLLGCEDSKPDKNPFAPPPKQTVEPAKDAGTAPPTGPPQLAIDDLGPKIGYTRVLLDKPEGRDRLAHELSETKEDWDGKEVPLTIDRRSKLAWVVAFIHELGKVGASKVVIKTETRKEFPTQLAFTPLAKAATPEPCALVAIVQDDRTTAVWKVAGGLAMKRAKGMAGPDLSTTADTIERLGKACSSSNSFFVSADPTVEWGLTYDLAASTKQLQDVKFDNIVLLETTPVPGHKVDLGK
jgi:hypothetical protein